ncbi:MAG: adenylosuccinate synthase [Pirellulales bacterium]|nr:adenylosuccinate synthase [Planctomycetales bacterium]
MTVTCVIGLQWGDEAKGKIVDLLTEAHDVVVRYQGGSNAGHTVVTGGKTYKLSLVPSGILRPGVQCVVTGGVVLNPASLLEEMGRLRSAGVEIGKNLMISRRAHVIFPWHMEEERVLDARVASDKSIGTTMRGIGPCYRDKVGRSNAIRLGDMYRPEFHDQVARIVEHKNLTLKALATNVDFKPLDAEAIFAEYSQYAAQLQPHVCDTTEYLLDAVESGQHVLFEGAQGALLDIDHGTFPYVTSSNSSGVGIPAGSGVPGKYLDKVIGVLKAYSTRVGGGPFPTELDNELGQTIRDRGNEYGTVTGRPRRCGWFDAVAARYAARLSGVDVLVISLLDVLSTVGDLKICVEYKLDGKRLDCFPSHVDDLKRVAPVYETLPGWDAEISDVRRYEDLPENARAYLSRISEVVGRPVEIVSVGADREQTLFADDAAAASYVPR